MTAPLTTDEAREVRDGLLAWAGELLPVLPRIRRAHEIGCGCDARADVAVRLVGDDGLLADEVARLRALREAAPPGAVCEPRYITAACAACGDSVVIPAVRVVVLGGTPVRVWSRVYALDDVDDVVSGLDAVERPR